jgi:hypothetical protein
MHLSLLTLVADLGRRTRGNVALVAKGQSVGLGMLTASLLSLLASVPPGRARFWVCDLENGPWLPVLNQIAAQTYHECVIIPPSELGRMLEGLTHSRSDSPTYVLIAGAHAPVTRDQPHVLATALERALIHGARLLIWCDSIAGLNYALTRAALDQVGYKVAGVMSAEHSASYLRSTAASKIDGSYQAVFVDVDDGDRLITFRPYSLPETDALGACLDRIKVTLT